MKWAKDNLDGYLNFYSVSGDGRVTNWTIVKTALWFTDTLNITFSKTLHNFSEEDTKNNLRDGGRCVAFNPVDDTMFLVGTDEGLIYKFFLYQYRFYSTKMERNPEKNPDFFWIFLALIEFTFSERILLKST